jgi:hypothetical protein
MSPSTILMPSSTVLTKQLGYDAVMRSCWWGLMLLWWDHDDEDWWCCDEIMMMQSRGCNDDDAVMRVPQYDHHSTITITVQSSQYNHHSTTSTVRSPQYDPTNRPTHRPTHLCQFVVGTSHVVVSTKYSLIPTHSLYLLTDQHTDQHNCVNSWVILRANRANREPLHTHLHQCALIVVLFISTALFSVLFTVDDDLTPLLTLSF